MHRLGLLAVLALVACTAAPPPVASYRNPSSPIYSSAVLLPEQIAGSWMQVADFAAAPGTCAAGPVEISQAPGGLQINADLCLAGQQRRLSGPLTPTGPGRFAAPGQLDPWWVLWADGDRRTLVIGTPSGRFGFVLNRGGVLPP
ncbi:MAG: lipocalin family protein, partial [Paracoccaceae bacterium]